MTSGDKRKEERAKYFESIFKEWKDKGYGSGQAYKAYTEIKDRIPKDYRWRKTDFLRAYREYAHIPKRITETEAKRKAYKHTRYDRRPTDKSIEYDIKYPKKGNYHHKTRVIVRNKDTGEIEERNITIATREKRPLTKREVEERIHKRFTEKEESERYEILRIEHLSVHGKAKKEKKKPKAKKEKPKEVKPKKEPLTQQELEDIARGLRATGKTETEIGEIIKKLMMGA